MRKGILFHRRRRFELAHLQEADTHRPFLARWLGMCSLRLSVSGQSAHLSYLSDTQAAVLRSALRRHMATEVPASGAATTAAESDVMLSVPARMLGMSLLLEVHTWFAAAVSIALGLVPYAVFHQPLTLLSAAGSLGATWRLTASRWPRWHGWTLTAEPGGYRADYGLFDRQHQTLRHQRTHAVELSQPLLGRRRGWVRISLATAGHQSPLLVAPVATWEQAEQLVRSLYGANGAELLRVRTPSPRRARWATLWSHVLSCTANAEYLCIWDGWFLRNRIHLAPVPKAQSVEVTQGPWQRFLRLATVRVALAGGSDFIARHRRSRRDRRTAPRDQRDSGRLKAAVVDES
ncbi:PH domain-containing protein [Streptomyces sp. NPDC046985]|uniref:PH domain-containing protein n=1 Tax=Streptomyces sp. NPDC046985 TaxID=3155377 RepID=UPI0034102C67